MLSNKKKIHKKYCDTTKEKLNPFLRQNIAEVYTKIKFQIHVFHLPNRKINFFLTTNGRFWSTQHLNFLSETVDLY